MNTTEESLKTMAPMLAAIGTPPIQFIDVALIEPPVICVGDLTLSIHADEEAVFVRIGPLHAPGTVLEVPRELVGCLWRTLKEMEDREPCAAARGRDESPEDSWPEDRRP